MMVSHHEGIKKTFTEFNEDVNRITRAMYEDLNLKRGNVVGLWSSNNYNWVSVVPLAHSQRLLLLLLTATGVDCDPIRLCPSWGDSVYHQSFLSITRARLCTAKSRGKSALFAWKKFPSKGD